MGSAGDNAAVTSTQGMWHPRSSDSKGLLLLEKIPVLPEVSCLVFQVFDTAPAPLAPSPCAVSLAEGWGISVGPGLGSSPGCFLPSHAVGGFSGILSGLGLTSGPIHHH